MARFSKRVVAEQLAKQFQEYDRQVDTYQRASETATEEWKAKYKEMSYGAMLARVAMVVTVEELGIVEEFQAAKRELKPLPKKTVIATYP